MDNQDALKHHCGVVGIFSEGEANIPEKLFYSLFSLQHRGQESAGIAYNKQGRIVAYKDLGMVSEVLARYLNGSRPSTVGIGHVRYSTQGGNRIENAQPICVACNKGRIALAHNGNISNSESLREELSREGSIFQATTDTELILHLLARSQAAGFTGALKETLSRLQGAYSLVMIHNQNLLAIRDPHGFRPLYLGRRGSLTVIASETCALEIQNITDYRMIKPGEMVVVGKQGIKSEILFDGEPRLGQCIFELIYFARPDSLVFDESVYLARKRMGAALARGDRDLLSGRDSGGCIVVPVPTSGNAAAIGYAQESGLSFEQGLTRNHYVGRSFIMPTTTQRELAVRMKLHPVKEIIRGREIFLVDDSLVRGTTSKILVSLLKESGAKAVHLRLSSPEIKWPCYFGIDIPTRSELISNSLSPDEIAATTGAATVRFIPLESLKACVSLPQAYCTGCFNGDYPSPPPPNGTHNSGCD
ncbi:MAG: amidophosphoribosyltransferase [Spirochaetales bacterium]|jgi:amidophosphoribosyltransferase|nr:amidophosphoribosyltransferase [Spirochaetales bacterium]